MNFNFNKLSKNLCHFPFIAFFLLLLLFVYVWMQGACNSVYVWIATHIFASNKTFSHEILENICTWPLLMHRNY